MTRRSALTLAATAAFGVLCAFPSAARAAPDDSVPVQEQSGLVPIPVGCPEPTPTDIVFAGTVVGKDYVDEFVRFEIDQLRAGSSTPWAVQGLIDVRYGDDFRFLEDGEQYLVGAAVDPDFGRLSSKVRPAEPLFGGNDVIGLDDTDVECPEIEDAVMTVHLDGEPVDSGLFSLLTDDRRLLAATILVPTAITIAVLIGLVIVRRLWGWGIQGIFALGRTAVTPHADQKATRVRRHRPPTE